MVKHEPIHFVLKGRKMVPAELMEWAVWFEDREGRRIGADRINGKFISTVAIGLKYELFETMVFDGEPPCDEIYQVRYDTIDQAEAGHAKACEWVRNGCKEEADG